MHAHLTSVAETLCTKIFIAGRVTAAGSQQEVHGKMQTRNGLEIASELPFGLISKFEASILEIQLSRH